MLAGTRSGWAGGVGVGFRRTRGPRPGLALMPRLGLAQAVAVEALYHKTSGSRTAVVLTFDAAEVRARARANPNPNPNLNPNLDPDPNLNPNP